MYRTSMPFSVFCVTFLWCDGHGASQMLMLHRKSLLCDNNILVTFSLNFQLISLRQATKKRTIFGAKWDLFVQLWVFALNTRCFQSSLIERMTVLTTNIVKAGSWWQLIQIAFLVKCNEDIAVFFCTIFFPSLSFLRSLLWL